MAVLEMSSAGQQVDSIVEKSPRLLSVVGDVPLIGSWTDRIFERRMGDYFPLELAKAVRGGERLSGQDRDIVEKVAKIDWSTQNLRMTDPKHRELVARAVGLGATMLYHFGNFTAVAALPHEAVVRYVNRIKGRPENQVGSITTTRDRMAAVFDWDKLPDTLKQSQVLDIMDTFYGEGPFGFLGPAKSSVPKHLSNFDPEMGIVTTQIIAPGYSCASNALLTEVLCTTGEDYLFITSANSSHHLTGNAEEPAHYKMSGLQKEFGERAGVLMVAHDDEDSIRSSYPKHQPQSTSILAFHRVGRDRMRAPTLTLVRHGSLHVDEIRDLLSRHGFALEIAERARNRLPVRQY